MCRLYAIISTTFVRESLIRDATIFLSELSIKHKDGWGVGYYNGGLPEVHKDIKPLSKNSVSKPLLENLKRSKIVLFHIRKASPNIPVNIDNVHPFKLENYIFAHNGTIKNYNKTILPCLSKKVKSSLDGHTDSEAMFYFLYNKLIQGDSYKDSFKDLVDLLDGSYSALNTILSDGLFLYVSSLWTEREKYYSLYYKIVEADGARSILIRSSGNSIDNNANKDAKSSDSSWNLIGNHKLMKISPDLRIEFEDV